MMQGLIVGRDAFNWLTEKHLLSFVSLPMMLLVLADFTVESTNANSRCRLHVKLLNLSIIVLDLIEVHLMSRSLIIICSCCSTSCDQIGKLHLDLGVGLMRIVIFTPHGSHEVVRIVRIVRGPLRLRLLVIGCRRHLLLLPAILRQTRSII